LIEIVGRRQSAAATARDSIDDGRAPGLSSSIVKPCPSAARTRSTESSSAEISQLPVEGLESRSVSWLQTSGYWVLFPLPTIVPRADCP